MDKPKKPYPEFPLFPHATKRWAKKIRGKLHYFGPWDDPDAALVKYLEQRDYLHAGIDPKPVSEMITVDYVCNLFLTEKKRLMASKELAKRTFDYYLEVAQDFCDHLGKTFLVANLRPANFSSYRQSLAERFGPHRTGNSIQCVRSIFKFAFESELIDRPIRFGPGFSRPSKKTFRIHRANQEPKLFSAKEIRSMLAIATPAMKAMVLLGINAGLGNSDCARLRQSMIDFETRWVNYPRPKTGAARRFPLWPETMATCKAFLHVRPKPKSPDYEDRLFITRFGFPWDQTPVTIQFGKLAKKVGCNRQGVGFYSLRHTFRTVADETKDQPAINHIMGHEPNEMASTYREKISDERLQAVVDYVRDWLFEK